MQRTLWRRKMLAEDRVKMLSGKVAEESAKVVVILCRLPSTNTLAITINKITFPSIKSASKKLSTPNDFVWQLELPNKVYQSSFAVDNKLLTLSDIKFIWSPPNYTYDRLWDKFYSQAMALRSQAGTLPVFSDDETLNWWFSGQRYLRKLNKLPPQRIRLLDVLGFTWGSFDTPPPPVDDQIPLPVVPKPSVKVGLRVMILHI